MLRNLAAAFAALLVLATAGLASAQTVGTALDDGNFTFINNTRGVAGQRIVAPGAGLKLQSFSFWIQRVTATFSVQPVVYEVTSGSTSGPSPLMLSPVWTGPITLVPAGVYPDQYTFTLDATVALDPAKTYVIAVRQATTGQVGRLYATLGAYAAGDKMYRDSSLAFQGDFDDEAFQATFAPLVEPVPTLSEWAMILFGAVLAGAGALYLQRRRLAA